MVEQERVRGEGERERRQPQSVQRRLVELVVVTSSGPSTAIVGPSQRTVPSGLDQRSGESRKTPSPVVSAPKR